MPKIVLVQDSLNTHKPASFYKTFPAGKARRLVERFEWQYIPKHGSRLEGAFSVVPSWQGMAPQL